MNDTPMTLVYLYINNNESYLIRPNVADVKAVLRNPNDFTFCGLLPVELKPQTKRITL